MFLHSTELPLKDPSVLTHIALSETINVLQWIGSGPEVLDMIWKANVIELM